jgi:hypothetical protein
MNSTDNTAVLTVLLSKQITSCDNVFIKGYFLLPTYGVFYFFEHIRFINHSIIIHLIFYLPQGPMLTNLMSTLEQAAFSYSHLLA